MEPNPIAAFVASALATKRIRFGDVRRLARGVQATRPIDRAEIETLLALDRAMVKADPEWTNFLTGAIREHMLQGADAEDETRAWLSAALGKKPTRTGAVIAREVAVALCAEAVPARFVSDPGNVGDVEVTTDPWEAEVPLDLEIEEAPTMGFSGFALTPFNPGEESDLAAMEVASLPPHVRQRAWDAP